MKQLYSEYTAHLFADPSYYGPTCTQRDADRIVKRLSGMIQRRFPGIDVIVWFDTIGGSAATTGPDVETAQEIDDWISDYWTAAL